jgi:cell division transport system permease protein
MIRALRYAIDEAVGSLWRGRQSGILSTATIALALFVLGCFLLVAANLTQLGEEWSSAAEMSVYVKDSATAADRATIERALAPASVVAGHEYVSKDEALARFRRTFGELSASIDGLGENPLPASYEVRLKPEAVAQGRVDRFVQDLRETPGVSDVRYDRAWFDRLLRAATFVRIAGLLLGSVLTVAAALTVANVVRLALYARRDEIEIMQLVGAPQAYIRGPFVVEGILQGGIGAAVSLVALGTGFLLLRARYLSPLASSINLASVRFLSAELCVFLVLGGMVVGCLGGLVAASRT